MRHHAYHHEGKNGGVSAFDKREVRHALWTGTDGRCAYCQVRIRKSATTLDHYLPMARGGTDEYHNLRCACLTCNRLKGGMHPSEWERTRPPPVVQVHRETRTQILIRIAQTARAQERRT